MITRRTSMAVATGRSLVALSLLLLVVVGGNALIASSAAADDDDGWVRLFNGQDLTGWVNVNGGPGTFFVRGGVIVTTGLPTGYMRTERQYENFEFEMEWMHVHPKGNSGLFIWADALPVTGSPFTRAIEVQVLDGLETENYTSHGDVFAIQGATMKPDRPHPAGWMRCLPSEKRAKPAGEWNHYKVVANNGVVSLAVNGKVVSGGSAISPRKGYICLESEGSETHFRNLRIKELPSTNPSSADIATPDEGFTTMYTGLDLAGWVADPGHAGHWQAKNYVLDYDGKSEATDKNLWTEKEYRDFVMICDWRLTAKPVKRPRPVILPNGDQALDDAGNPKETEVLDAGDSGIYLRGSGRSQVNIWCWPVGSGEVYSYRMDKSMPAEVRAGVTPKVHADNPPGSWNRFIITMKGDRLTVVLNGKTVIENAQLPGVAPSGRIALQHHGDSIQFANLFIKPLDKPVP